MVTKIFNVFVLVLNFDVFLLTLTCPTYIPPDNKSYPLSPGYTVKPFTLSPSDLTFRLHNGHKLSSEGSKDVSKIQVTEFTSINQAFLAWKRAILIGVRSKITASKLKGSLGLYKVDESLFACTTSVPKICKEHDWKFFNANKDNVIYQAVRKIVSNKENCKFIEELTKCEEKCFQYKQSEGPLTHWGIGKSAATSNTYGHILKSIRCSINSLQYKKSFQKFYVGPKTKSEDPELGKAGEALGTE